MTGLLLDEMLSAGIAEQLRSRGHDAMAVVERPSWRGMPDEDVLAVAAAEGRVVVTMNVVDFITLERAWASQGRRHSGILLVSSRRFVRDRGFVGRLVTALDAAIAADQLPRPGASRFL